MKKYDRERGVIDRSDNQVPPVPIYPARNDCPVPPHPPDGLLPHLRRGDHILPHIRSSMIRLEFDEEVMKRLNEVFGKAAVYVLNVFDRCPPEVKIALSIALDIPVNMEGYPKPEMQEPFQPQNRPQSVFMTDENTMLLMDGLDCSNSDAALSVLNMCPPEQLVIAIVIAYLKKRLDDGA
jgi:hypothetical protein